MRTRSLYSIADIARLAGVSKSTVSRALNDSPLIGQETKERIRAIAREHDYQVNLQARRLSLRQSCTIAFVIHAYHGEFSVADLFVLEIMGSISNGLYAEGYDMLLAQVNPLETGWAHEYLDSGRVDGFVLLTSTRKQAHIRALVEMGAPFIVWGVSESGGAYCSVGGDNLAGGRLAAEHLLRSGRRRIAFLGGPAEELEIRQRFAGYEAALREAGIGIDSALVTHGEYSRELGATGMQRLLERAPHLDAVLAASDLMALAAMQVLRERGRRIPEDVAVVGYDDLSIAAYGNPPLTTIRQDIPLAGRLLARNLVHYLQTGEVTAVTMPVELVVRGSA